MTLQCGGAARAARAYATEKTFIGSKDHMPFSQGIKDKARWKSAYRCCVCHDVFVEVHHLIPEADGGPSTIENAAPLCAKHHDLFGGNPEKRAMIRAMRDAWWQEVAEIRAARTDFFERNPPYEIPVNQHSEFGLQEMPLLMYHMVREDQGFAETAQTLHKLLKKVQDHRPNRRRVRYVDISGLFNAVVLPSLSPPCNT